MNEGLRIPDPAPLPKRDYGTLRARADELEEEVKGKECRNCPDVPRVAWVLGEYRLRCGCFPAYPQLYRRETPYEHYARTGEGDSVTIMQAERRLNVALERTDQQMRELRDTQEGEGVLVPLTPKAIAERIDAIAYIKTRMKDNVHYGQIVTKEGKKLGKPSLWLPGAELVRMALNIPVMEMEPPETVIDEQRKTVKSTIRLGVVHNGQVLVDVRRSASSDEPRFKGSAAGGPGFQFEDLRDIVPQRAWKRAFIQIINVMSGLSGEFQDGEYEEPEETGDRVAGPRARPSESAPTRPVDEETGEIPESPAPVASEPPGGFPATTDRSDWLITCPDHNNAWVDGTYGKYHRQGNASCSMTAFFNAACEAVTGWTQDQLAPWLKEHFGATMSKLSPEQKLAAFEALEAANQKPDADILEV